MKKSNNLNLEDAEALARKRHDKFMKIHRVVMVCYNEYSVVSTSNSKNRASYYKEKLKEISEIINIPLTRDDK